MRFSSIIVNAQGFGWAVSPRQGHELVARGEKVSVRSLIRAETEPGELEMVHATIAVLVDGRGLTAQDQLETAGSA